MLKEKFPNDYDELRKILVNLLESKYQTENPGAYESGFLGYFIDSLSQLTLDSLFYSSLSYNEAFLNKAALPESVLNIASQLSYNVLHATPASVDALISIPFQQDGERLWDALAFNMKENDTFSANGITYSLPYTVHFDFDYTIDPVKMVLTKETDNLIEKVPYNFLTLTDDQGTTTIYLQYVLTLEQYEIKNYSYFIPQLQPLQFYNIDVPLESQFYKMEVFVKEPTSLTYESWGLLDSIFSLPLGAQAVAYTIFDDKVVLTFGNGIYGKQPSANASITVNIYETSGKDGKIIANQITTGPRYNDISLNGNQGIVTYIVTNPVVSTDGVNKESIDEVKVNARDFARATNGLVSEKNYKNLTAILRIPLQDSLAILKRSDIHSNDIYTFLAIKGVEEDTFVPTRSDVLTLSTSDNNVFHKTLVVGGHEYICPYEIKLDLLNKKAYYNYILSDIINTPAVIATTQLDSQYSVVITSYQIIYDDDVSKFRFRLFYDHLVLTPEGEIDLQFSQNLSISLIINSNTYTTTNDVGNKYFEVLINRSDIQEDVFDIQMDLSYQGNLIKSYRASEMLINDLSDIIVSDLEVNGNTVTVFDVPVILNSYYSINHQWLDINVLQKLGYFASEIKNYRMLTDQVYFKFANTHGLVNNILFNNLTPHSIKTYSSSYFELPLALRLKVYVKQENMTKSSLIINAVQEAVFSKMKEKFGFEQSIYLSEILKITQDVDYVEFCEILDPDDSLVYDYNKSDLTQDDMIRYVPEYVSIDKNNILVTVVVDLDNN